MVSLEDIVKETRAAFIIAKSDGVLDSSEVIEIAIGLVQKIQKIANLSGSEKKSILLHALKKGLDDSGGLDSLSAFAGIPAEAKAAIQEQLLNAASSAVDLVLSAASGKLDLSKPSLPCILSCVRSVTALMPKEQKILEDALKFTGAKAEVTANVEVTEVTVVKSQE